MSLLHYNKVFVLAPNKFASGGPELSHQLVDYLRNKGVDASIVYVTNRTKGVRRSLVLLSLNHIRNTILP